MTAAVVSCASLVFITNLLDVLPDFFLHHVCRGSIRVRSLTSPTIIRSLHYCVFFDYFEGMSPTPT